MMTRDYYSGAVVSAASASRGDNGGRLAPIARELRDAAAVSAAERRAVQPALAVARRVLAAASRPPPCRASRMEHRTFGAGPDVSRSESPSRARPSGALLWVHDGGVVMGAARQDHAVWCARSGRRAQGSG